MAGAGGSGSGGVVAGMAVLGFVAYVVINMVIGFVAIAVAQDRTAVFAVAAVLLALISLGGGLALILKRLPWSKGLGLGLMLGWALTSIVSAGWCTGLNPGMYA
jgi:hypothetical protein